MIELLVKIGKGKYWWKIENNILYVYDYNINKFVKHPYAKKYEKEFEGKTEKEIVELIETELKKQAEEEKGKFPEVVKKFKIDEKDNVKILKVKYK